MSCCFASEAHLDERKIFPATSECYSAASQLVTWAACTQSRVLFRVLFTALQREILCMVHWNWVRFSLNLLMGNSCWFLEGRRKRCNKVEFLSNIAIPLPWNEWDFSTMSYHIYCVSLKRNYIHRLQDFHSLFQKSFVCSMTEITCVLKKKTKFFAFLTDLFVF